jgi:cytochrome oxidase assembly protein ShyY1
MRVVTSASWHSHVGSGSVHTVRILLAPKLLLLHLAGIGVVIAAVFLGNWQYNAWQIHRDERAADLADAEPRPITELLGGGGFPGSAVGAPVEVDGTWLPEDTFFVAERMRKGEVGYWMVAPLGCDPVQVGACTSPATLVVLGWVEEPTGVLEPGDARVEGWLQPSDPTYVTDDDLDDDVLPALRVESVLQRLDVDLRQGYVIARTVTPTAATGVLPVTPQDLPDPPASTALRNLFYGLQWWIFGGFAVFMWWRWSMDAILAARRVEQDAVDAAVASGP